MNLWPVIFWLSRVDTGRSKLETFSYKRFLRKSVPDSSPSECTKNGFLITFSLYGSCKGVFNLSLQGEILYTIFKLFRPLDKQAYLTHLFFGDLLYTKSYIRLRASILYALTASAVRAKPKHATFFIPFCMDRKGFLTCSSRFRVNKCGDFLRM